MKSGFSSKTQCPHSSITPPSALLAIALAQSKQCAPKDLRPPQASMGIGQLAAGQFFGLFGHLRNVAIVIEARSKVARLLHLHHIELKLFIGNGIRVVCKVPEKMAEILIFAPFHQEPRDIHVHMHSEMPIRHTRVHITRKAQSEERGFYCGERQRPVRRKVRQRHRRRPAQVVAEDVKARDAFGVQ